MDTERKLFNDIIDDRQNKDVRLNNLETVEATTIYMFQADGVRYWSSDALTGGAMATSVDMSAWLGLDRSIRGVIGVIFLDGAPGSGRILFAPSPAVPGTTDMIFKWEGIASDGVISQFMMLQVGNDGKFNYTPSNNSIVTFNIFGYWI